MPCAVNIISILLVQFKCLDNGGKCQFSSSLLYQSWKTLGVFGKKFFFRFYCTKKTGHKITTQEKHLIYTILPVTWFSINYKTHKSRVKYEIKYDIYKIAQK